jgi:amino acid transporter
LLVILGLLAIKGIGESAKAAALFTVIEIIGLLLVIWFGKDALGHADVSSMMAIDPIIGVGGVIAGAFLAFYAFIGFEDMVNVAEEVKNPRKTMPIAILLSLLFSTALYLLVVIVATTVVNPTELAASDAPLALVFERTGIANPGVLALIGMMATLNGVIVQIIMGSRVLYGLSSQGWIHSKLSALHQKHKTPVPATLIVVGAMIISTAILPLVSLAQLTSLLVLGIFTLVNISLIVIKRREKEHQGYITVPIIIPFIGAILCVSTIGYQLFWN